MKKLFNVTIEVIMLINQAAIAAYYARNGQFDQARKELLR
jgi:hypothetical protein